MPDYVLRLADGSIAAAAKGWDVCQVELAMISRGLDGSSADVELICRSPNAAALWLFNQSSLLSTRGPFHCSANDPYALACELLIKHDEAAFA